MLKFVAVCYKFESKNPQRKGHGADCRNGLLSLRQYLDSVFHEVVEFLRLKSHIHSVYIVL
nr:MAG TPA: hypothetical protein [Caudoviricetes sp.]